MSFSWSDLKPKLHDHAAVMIVTVFGVLFLLIGSLWLNVTRVETEFRGLTVQMDQKFGAQAALLTGNHNEIKEQLQQRLGGQDRQLERLQDRMDRWSNEFPVLARSEIMRPVELAIVTSAPVQNPTGWQRAVTVINPTDKTQSTFLITSATPASELLTNSLLSWASVAEERPLTLHQVTKLSNVAGMPINLPAYVDGENSYVFTMPMPSYDALLREKFGVEPRTRRMTTRFDQSRDVVRQLYREPAQYAVAK